MSPTRFISSVPADPREHRLASFLERTDPLADAVIEALVPLPRPEQEALVARLVSTAPGQLPPALATFHEWLRETPVWFDEARAEVGGEVLLRTGLLSGLVLGFKSLVLGYCSPAGNKPLIFSGRLTGDVNKRLAETARFVEAVSEPAGLRFGAPGFIATVRVRLIHARVRHALQRSAQWRAQDWGAPINQYDMAGTVLLFSSMLLDGLRQLGARITDAEEDATLHQWRFVGRLMGVEDELLSTTAHEAKSLWAMLEKTQGLPDVDSRRLTNAMINEGTERGAPVAAIDFGAALCRHLIGPRYADALELPRGTWDLAPRMLSGVVRRMDDVVRFIPGAKLQALRLGEKYWRRSVSLTFGDAEVPFELPANPLRPTHGR
ncbi:MAG: oxygenase MpaB family protein [Myxococcales bacterium]|nr:oxygenase MpaB family protein [Myxococcales bacterium]